MCDVGVELELCWRDDQGGELAAELEREYGVASVSCSPTPRHIGWCLYQCPAPAHGCNALDGCFCPP